MAKLRQKQKRRAIEKRYLCIASVQPLSLLGHISLLAHFFFLFVQFFFLPYFFLLLLLPSCIISFIFIVIVDCFIFYTMVNMLPYSHRSSEWEIEYDQTGAKVAEFTFLLFIWVFFPVFIQSNFSTFSYKNRLIHNDLSFLSNVLKSHEW